MRLEYRKLSSLKDFQQLEDLAKVIWHEHYIPIIGKPQVEYMMEKFQKAEIMQEQSAKGEFQYYTANVETYTVGYMAYRITREELFLSKFYLLKQYRGTGLSRRMLEFLESQALANDIFSINLTVNKYNSASIAAYNALGFDVTEEVIFEIGNGYIMDDFRMIKKLA